MMKIVALIVIASILFFGACRIVKAQRLDTDGGQVTMAELPLLIQKLKSSGSRGSFFVLLIPNTSFIDGYEANLQLSIEGDLGVDWVLMAQRNIADKDKFAELAQQKGLNIASLSMNNVSYLRVTGSDLIDLASAVLTDIYKVNPETKLQLIITGFQWP